MVCSSLFLIDCPFASLSLPILQRGSLRANSSIYNHEKCAGQETRLRDVFCLSVDLLYSISVLWTACHTYPYMLPIIIVKGTLCNFCYVANISIYSYLLTQSFSLYCVFKRRCWYMPSGQCFFFFATAKWYFEKGQDRASWLAG